MNDDIVIIGAGHAGVRAALAIRAAGFKAPVVMIADEGCELPYERPPLSKWSGEVQTMAKAIVPAEQLDDAQIQRITSKVMEVDSSSKRILLSDGMTHRYSKLLLATGARARRLPDALVGDSPIHYLRDTADANKIRRAAESVKHTVIVGGGFIGLELAASMRKVGVDVHVIEAADRLLSRAVSARVSQIVHQLHGDHDVRFSLGASIDEISTPRGFVKINGSAVIKADMVIAGVGSEPDMDLARDAGLKTANGICVDYLLRSSDPDIFAAGDCCSFPLYGSGGPATRLESWQAAGDQGSLAGFNMVSGTPSSYMSVPWFWSEQYDHVLQVAGLPAPDMEFVERPYSDTHHVTFGINRDGSLGYACGIAPELKVAKDIRLAMKLIEKANPVDKHALADSETALKSLR